MQLSRNPRLRSAHLPTSLEPLPRISEATGDPKLWINRDSSTGLSSGGDKTYKPSRPEGNHITLAASRLAADRPGKDDAQ